MLVLRDLTFDCPPSGFARVLDRWLDGAVDDTALGYTREEFVEHVRTEHSTYRWLLEPMLVAAGFEILSVAYRRSVYASYTCVRRPQ